MPIESMMGKGSFAQLHVGNSRSGSGLYYTPCPRRQRPRGGTTQWLFLAVSYIMDHEMKSVLSLCSRSINTGSPHEFSFSDTTAPLRNANFRPGPGNR